MYCTLSKAKFKLTLFLIGSADGRKQTGLLIQASLNKNASQGCISLIFHVIGLFKGGGVLKHYYPQGNAFRMDHTTKARPYVTH